MSERSLIYDSVVSKQRAEPLSPSDRRRAIAEAVIPLLKLRGAGVTTREMAEAAGVAEGTLFRAFPDKCSLVHHAIEVSMDPSPMKRALAEVYQGATVEVQLAEAARIMLEGFEEAISLMAVLRSLPPAQGDHSHNPPAFVVESNRAVMEALTDLFERHREILRLEPSRAAAAFMGLIFASGHPIVAPGQKLTVAEIVSVLLSGVALEEVH